MRLKDPEIGDPVAGRNDDYLLPGGDPFKQG